MLESIHKNKKPKQPRILIYSEGGVGKSTFASQAPDPVFLCTEDGLATISVDSTDLLRNYDAFIQYLLALRDEQHKYKTVVVDSLDQLEILIHRKVCENFKVKSIEALGYGRGYVEAALIWQYIFNLLDDLRDTRNMIVILICHAEIKKFDDPTSESYERYQLKLHKRASALAVENVDCLLFATYKTMLQRDRSDRARLVSSGERVIYTEARPSFLAKNRYSLPPELPLDFNSLFKLIHKK